MSHAMDMPLTLRESGPNATSTLMPIATKHAVSMLLWSFSRAKLIMVPAMAAVHMKANSDHPHAPHSLRAIRVMGE